VLHFRSVDNFLIRRAVTAERSELESLQLRASLTNTGDRDALLAHPDAIHLPAEQIAAGGVFVWERHGAIAGFAALLPRTDGDTDLDALFVEPESRRCGIGRSLVEHCARIAHIGGSAALWVVGNPHAYDFYIACSFNLAGMTENPLRPWPVDAENVVAAWRFGEPTSSSIEEPSNRPALERHPIRMQIRFWRIP